MQILVMSGREAAVLQRHVEIRSALQFFLNSWYKHKQAGTVPHPQQVMRDFVRFRSLEALKSLQTPAHQVVKKN